MPNYDCRDGQYQAIETGEIMSFEWDPKKTRVNLREHGVTFEEASSALRDQLSATGHDPDHSEDEDRFVTFGFLPEVACLRCRTPIGEAQFALFPHE